MAGFVYFMGAHRDGPLYTGITADLHERIYQHKQGIGSAFCKRYGLKMLVYFEHFNRIGDAIAREKTVKKWRRAWKNDLVDAMNSEWNDLYLTLNK